MVQCVPYVGEEPAACERGFRQLDLACFSTSPRGERRARHGQIQRRGYKRKRCNGQRREGRHEEGPSAQGIRAGAGRRRCGRAGRRGAGGGPCRLGAAGVHRGQGVQGVDAPGRLHRAGHDEEGRERGLGQLRVRHRGHGQGLLGRLVRHGPCRRAGLPDPHDRPVEPFPADDIAARLQEREEGRRGRRHLRGLRLRRLADRGPRRHGRPRGGQHRGRHGKRHLQIWCDARRMGRHGRRRGGHGRRLPGRAVHRAVRLRQEGAHLPGGRQGRHAVFLHALHA